MQEQGKCFQVIFPTLCPTVIFFTILNCCIKQIWITTRRPTPTHTICPALQLTNASHPLAGLFSPNYNFAHWLNWSIAIKAPHPAPFILTNSQHVKEVTRPIFTLIWYLTSVRREQIPSDGPNASVTPTKTSSISSRRLQSFLLYVET